ncbi:MAG TPA: hypothetical protein VFB39_02800 [Solirubrobacteraceae bacterium]|nr:hypothetical protein [Solirubrobacteraceae bacterium]
MKRGHAVGRRGAIAAAAALLLSAGTAAAATFVDLDGRVDKDSAAGISPKQDAGELDAVGGSVVAGQPAVPWTDFEKKTSGAQQIFSRAFNGTSWVTKGSGTVGGASSASPTFTGSLNFNQARDGEAPSIDFAGAGRAVPWATWYEDNTSPFGKKEIFAARFDSTADLWDFAGQGRNGSSAAGPTSPPSLNIRTDKNAENPDVAGGSAVNPAAPGPWIVWQEQGPTKNQIFVVRPIGPGTTTCPAGTKPAGGAPEGGFCWQQVGVERSPISSPSEPSLNVDPARAGIEPDIAFTGTNDAVPWVVWYEVGKGGHFGVTNERVFAAKAVAGDTVDQGTDDGGFFWEAVGNNTAGGEVLDTSGPNHAGACLASKAAENKCTLNRSPNADAEDPRVAAGTMTSGQPTVPWVVWAEEFQGVKRIFASRLVGGTHFELANGGKPLSSTRGDADVPDISFAGHTPFITYRQKIGKSHLLFVGHFSNAANPTFHLDTPTGIKRSTSGLSLAVAEPASSNCTANPFNSDGDACQGGVAPKAFFLFNDGAAGARRIFGEQFK